MHVQVSYVINSFAFLFIQKGLTITIEQQQLKFYGTLTLVPGDNLASQYLGGYKSLASAHRKCRNCMATNKDMETKVSLQTICLICLW